MYLNVFKRVEEKYLLTKEEKNKFFDKIKDYLEKDEFFESKVCNIYFDTNNKDLVIHSLEKPIYKDKVRLRSYNVPTLNDSVFLEIKNKYKGIVGKRRIKIKLKDFYEYYEKGIIKNNSQIMQEIDYLFKYYQLKPSLYIAYDRKSYRGCEDNNLRITIDSNLRSRKEDLRLELGDAGKKYFDKEYYIMEIKTLNAFPLWLVKCLSELKIYPTSLSKYGSIYKKENLERNVLNVN